MNIEITLTNEDGEVLYRGNSGLVSVIEMMLGDIEKLMLASVEVTDF